MTTPLYRTTDPYLAAFLCSRGVPLEGCTRLRPKKAEFRFPADRDLHGLLRLYRSGQFVPVIPAELFAALRRLKTLYLRHDLPRHEPSRSE